MLETTTFAVNGKYSALARLSINTNPQQGYFDADISNYSIAAGIRNKTWREESTVYLIIDTTYSRLFITTAGYLVMFDLIRGELFFPTTNLEYP